jgi:hypothetical protein
MGDEIEIALDVERAHFFDRKPRRPSTHELTPAVESER